MLSDGIVVVGVDEVSLLTVGFSLTISKTLEML